MDLGPGLAVDGIDASVFGLGVYQHQVPFNGGLMIGCA